MKVAHVHWPDEKARRDRLRRQRWPRLLLVDAGTPPPDEVDDLEDWVRLPADEVDLKARAEHLIMRCQHHLDVTPSLEGGVLRVGSNWVSLSPLEARLTAILVDRMGVVIARDTLVHAGWPDGANVRNTLDVHLVRLRRRLASVGLSIHTVRSRGYLLDSSGFCEQDVPDA